MQHALRAGHFDEVIVTKEIGDIIPEEHPGGEPILADLAFPGLGADNQPHESRPLLGAVAEPDRDMPFFGHDLHRRIHCEDSPVTRWAM